MSFSVLVIQQLPHYSGSGPDEKAQRRGQNFTSESPEEFPAAKQTPQFQFRSQVGHVEICFPQRAEERRGHLRKSPD